VKYEANWKYVLTIPAGMMSIFLMLMLVPDVGLRLHHASQERLLHMARPAVLAVDSSNVDTGGTPADSNEAPPPEVPGPK
jgi:hypothetical protein